MTSIINSKINKIETIIIDNLLEKEISSLYQEIKREWSFHWFQYIKDNTDKRWNYHSLSENKNITWEIVQANQDKPWDYYSLNKNPNITWEIVQANPKLWKNNACI